MPDAMTAAPPAQPPAGAVPPPPGPGATGPATVTPDTQGLRARGIVKVNLGLSMLDQAVAMLGSASEEGRELMSALVKLRKTFGQTSPDLNRQEVKMLGQQAPAVGQAPGGGGDLAAQIKQRLAGMMGGGGAPGQAGPTPGG